MRMHSPQDWPNALIRTAIALALFVLSAVPFYGLSPKRINYTGLLNQRPVLTCLCMIPLGLFYAWIFYREGCQFFPKDEWKRKTALLLGMIVLVMIVPYGMKEDFFSGLHVLLAYGTLIVYGFLMSQLLYSNKPLFQLFGMGMILSFFLAVSDLSVSGRSELAFSLTNALVFSFLLPLPEKNPSGKEG